MAESGFRSSLISVKSVVELIRFAIRVTSRASSLLTFVSW
jgi:hypothetical protein